MKLKSLCQFALTTCIVSLLTAGGFSKAQSTDLISEKRLNSAISVFKHQTGQEVTAEQRDQIRQRLLETEILKQAALKKNLDKSTNYRMMLEEIQADLLASALVQDFINKNPVTEVELRRAYLQVIQSNQTIKEYNVQHILVPSQKEAEQLIQSLRKGKAFERLAHDTSQDAGSKNNGGQLGWVTPESLDTSFSQAMLSLKKGEISRIPVKSSFGWHVIKLNNIRSPEINSYSEMTPKLKQQIQQEKIQQYVNSLLKQKNSL